MESINVIPLEKPEQKEFAEAFPKAIFPGQFKICGDGASFFEITYSGDDGYFKLQVQNRFVRLRKNSTVYDVIVLLDFIEITPQARVMPNGERRSFVWLEAIGKFTQLIANKKRVGVKFMLEAATPQGKKWCGRILSQRFLGITSVVNDYDSSKGAYGFYISYN